MYFSKRAPVKWVQGKNTIKYGIGNIFVGALGDYITWCLIMLATTGCIVDVWPKIKMNPADIARFRFSVGMFIIFFEIIVPLVTRKLKRPYGNIMRIFLCLAGGVECGFLSYRFYIEQSDKLFSGMRYVWGQFLNNYNYYYDDTYIIPKGTPQNASVVIAFTAIIFAAACLALTMIVNTRALWIIMPVLVLGGEMFVGCYPGWKSLAYLFMAWFLIMAFSRPSKRAGESMTRRRIGKIVIPMSLVHGVLAILLLGLITLGVPAAFKTRAQEIMDNRETVKEYQSNIEDQASFVTDYMMAKYLDENRLLVGTNPPSFTNEKVFTMTMPKKAYSNIYQRNFIGADYVNGGWDYDGKEFEEACKAAGISLESARYEIESGAFRRMTDPTFRENGKVLGALETPFEYDIEYNSGDEISLLAPYFTSGEISGSVLTEDVLPVRGLFTKNAQIKALSRPTLSPMELRTLSTNELAENEETIWKFYDQYVLSHYTKGSDVVPTAKEAAAWLVKPCDESDDMSINIWRMNMIERVTAVFSAYDYSWEVYAPNNMDAVEYFLNEGHQGYCIHFATAGALILREMGIPARFAGGYIVNGAKFIYSASDEAYKQDVYDRDAHAWVEVYLNHIGWVPVECTPSYTMKDESLTTGQESKELLGRPSEVLIRESSYYKNARESAALINSANGIDKDSVKGINTGNKVSSPTAIPTSPDETKTVAGNKPETSDENEGKTQEDKEEKPKEDEKSLNEDKSFENAKGNSDKLKQEEASQDELEEALESETDEAKETETEDELETREHVDYDTLKIVGKVVALIVVSLALICFANTVIKVRSRNFRKMLQNGMAKGDYSRVVRKINRRIYKNLRMKGKILKLYPTDAEYEVALRNAYGDKINADWGFYMQIVKEAKFAKHELTKEQAMYCLDIYNELGGRELWLI